MGDLTSSMSMVAGGRQGTYQCLTLHTTFDSQSDSDADPEVT